MRKSFIAQLAVAALATFGSLSDASASPADWVGSWRLDTPYGPGVMSIPTPKSGAEWLKGTMVLKKKSGAVAYTCDLTGPDLRNVPGNKALFLGQCRNPAGKVLHYRIFLSRAANRFHGFYYATTDANYLEMDRSKMPVTSYITGVR